jgi:aminoglycoside phosphotransferase (APT) family kinase protein
MHLSEPWTPERVVDLGLAQALIGSQFPEFAPVRAHLLGHGFDNTAFLVNETTVFRFPRRHVAVACLEAEIRSLPRIGPSLPVVVPFPQWVGEPEARFPWTFAGYRWIPGVPLVDLCLDLDARRELAPALGTLLSALHALDVREMRVALDPLDRLSLPKRLPRFRSRLDDLVSFGYPDLARIAGAMMTLTVSRIEAGPALGPPTVVGHGDLDARHLLADDASNLSGLIDWGDVHAGHRATDLGIAYEFLPPDAREAFWSAYGRNDETLQWWARFRALDHALAVLVWALAVDNRPVIREATFALTQAGSP